ncbi:MAG TPA: DegQ family serine endoprotease [Burkholderiaceae bacterium]|nr:DegQ family serine endoprotease [Burkholderiaceae bacterium]
MLTILAAWPAATRAQSPTTLPDFSELVERVGPSVVNIRTTERVRAGQMPGPQMDEEMQEFFRRFFGIPLPGPRPDPRRNPRQPPQEEELQRGLGSGFILSADGYVMTNAHVVEGADEVYVTLADKREFKAKIVGSDKRTDVAVVKIDASGLQPVRVGDVSKLKVGEWVVAIGSPFGLENTVTAGIVSAKARETGDYLPFIQTDVAINPGNSGGPLLNMRGEVVGINSQIYSRSGGFMGISFAIPIDEAMRVADQLRTTGRVIRGRIGVQIDQVSREVAESIGLGKPTGALVRSVEEGGPAARAGLEPGDIITRFDGKPVEKASDLPRIVGNTKPGSKVDVQVFRRGATRTLNVTVAEFEPERVARATPSEQRPSAPPTGAAGALGLVVADLTPAQQRELNLRGGVRVEVADGAAARAGLREGDVILAVANTEVKDVKQFEQVLGRIDKTKPFNILFRRGEWAQYAVIRPSRG